MEKETNQTRPFTILYWTFSSFLYFFFFFHLLTCNQIHVKLMRFLDEVVSKKTSSLGCGWNANESKLKVIFFILLLLLIAVGSVQINVASMKTEDESKINRFYKQKFQIIFVFPTIQTSSQNH